MECACLYVFERDMLLNDFYMHCLQEEFLKWKDSLFFRYAVVLADPVHEIARYNVHKYIISEAKNYIVFNKALSSSFSIE